MARRNDSKKACFLSLAALSLPVEGGTRELSLYFLVGEHHQKDLWLEKEHVTSGSIGGSMGKCLARVWANVLHVWGELRNERK